MRVIFFGGLSNLRGLKGRRFWIGVVFFCLFAAPGFWIPVVGVILRERGWEEWTRWVFVLPSVLGLLSPMFIGAQADQRFSAEKVLAWTVGGGAVLLYAAFWCLQNADDARWFLFFLGLNALVVAPSFSILSAIAFETLDDPKRQFGMFRVWGTLGWIGAGWVVSGLDLDQSPVCGMLAAGARLLAGMACLLLPHTPPRAVVQKGWREAMGFGALVVLRRAEVRAVMLTSFFLTIPLAAFYQQTSRHFEDLGVSEIAQRMTAGQYLEVFALLSLGVVLGRMRLKWVLGLGMLCAILRYGFNVVGAMEESSGWIWAGALLHGLVISYYYEAVRIFINGRVEKGMRAQTQALTGVITGVAGILGALFTEWLYEVTVLRGVGGEGWVLFWEVLLGMVVFAGIVFLLLYRGRKVGAE